MNLRRFITTTLVGLLRPLCVPGVAALALAAAATAQLPQDRPLHLKLAGAGRFDTGAEVPVADAVLFLDSTNFDGKSGFVRLQKGMTVAYLVISSRAISGETAGVFEKKPFLQANLTPLPKLPALAAPDDYTVTIRTFDFYDPRKQATSTLQQAMAGTPITKLTSMAPWISSVVVPSVVVDSLHLHIVNFNASTPSRPGKIHDNGTQMFMPDRTAIVHGAGVGELHLQCRQTELPIDPAPVVLRRESKGWIATLDLKSKEISIRGTFPVRLATPVERTINEYAGKN
jgi:hypothetical protein